MRHVGAAKKPSAFARRFSSRGRNPRCLRISIGGVSSAGLRFFLFASFFFLPPSVFYGKAQQQRLAISDLLARSISNFGCPQPFPKHIAASVCCPKLATLDYLPGHFPPLDDSSASTAPPLYFPAPLPADDLKLVIGLTLFPLIILSHGGTLLQKRNSQPEL